MPTINCPRCGTEIAVPAIERRAQCGNCGAVIPTEVVRDLLKSDPEAQQFRSDYPALTPGEFFAGIAALVIIGGAFVERSGIAAAAGVLAIFAVAIVARLRMIVHELRSIRFEQLRENERRASAD